jgi:hypothetical protein
MMGKLQHNNRTNPNQKLRIRFLGENLTLAVHQWEYLTAILRHPDSAHQQAAHIEHALQQCAGLKRSG